MMNQAAMALGALLGAATGAIAANPTYKTQQLSDKFYSEGANFADFNQDGKMDIVSGPFWYEGPDFTKKHQIYKPTGKHEEGSYKADGEYSNNFFAFTYDFTADGYPDVLVYGFPGADASIFVNPGKDVASATEWRRHIVADVVDNESPQFTDINGDGKPEAIFHSHGFLGYATINWDAPLAPWHFHAISPYGGWQRFTHGYGVGDVNGDGRVDILESKSWWEQPANAKPTGWIRHPYNFAQQGGAQMYVYDVDGDGKNDVVTSLQAHGVGLAWFRQVKDEKGQITFEKNLIMPEKYEPNQQGIKFSQLHAVELVDMNGDGLKDIVTGKRYFAHHSKGDVAPLDPPVVYWFELKRDSGKVRWIGHLIHDNSGVGTQVTVGDVNGDKVPDVVVGNKKGTFVSLSRPATEAKTVARD